MDVPKCEGLHTHVLWCLCVRVCVQALEAEALIPLSMANKMTKLVLAGDKMQVRRDSGCTGGDCSTGIDAIIDTLCLADVKSTTFVLCPL